MTKRIDKKAIGGYVVRTDEAELERRYFEGYRRFPDDDNDFRAMEKAAIEDMAKRQAPVRTRETE